MHKSAVKKALFSCSFDESRSMLDCSHKNWSELMYLTEAAKAGSAVPARTINSGERSIDFDMDEKATKKAQKKAMKATVQKNQ